MRIDKYLKVSRLVKRRVIAKQMLDANRVLINGNIAKTSTSIKENDIIELQYGNRVIKVKVLKIAEFTTKEDANLLYEVI